MVLTAQVLLEAGHKGRTSGATGASGPLGNEKDWTPIVVDEATRLLRLHNITVLSMAADDLDDVQGAKVDLAISIHFDGNNTPCASGTSIGYPVGTPAGSNKPAADEWRSLWKPIWPFKWMPDNFTGALRNYKEYSDWSTSDAEMLIELGEISCLEQAQWLKPRLKYIGALVAHFASNRVGGNVPHPGDYDEPLPLFDDVLTGLRERIDQVDQEFKARTAAQADQIAALQKHQHKIKGETT
jgi:N-acetylmuramoyl-L-alanine amidase